MSSAVADHLIGSELDGRYRVLERLADGGMATVYLAVDTRLDREVALKVMHADLAQDPAFVARFHREARSAARLSHPNVVGVYDQGEDRGLMFLAMEYVPGQTLRQVLDTEGALSPRAATDILLPVLLALGAAHRAGLIHRDVKPENVLLREDGVVKVADFGLARAVSNQTSSTSGVLLGTASYLSPEQVERGIADARSDVYAAGLLLFEMLTGTKAISGDHPVHVAYQHVHAGVPAASSRADGIPAVLDEVVATATAKDPDDRPADAVALAALVRTARRELTPAELDSRPVGPAATAAAAQATTVAAAPPSPAATTTALPTQTGIPPAAPAATEATAQLPVRAPAAPSGPSTTAPQPVLAPRRRRRVGPWIAVVLAAALVALTGWYFLAGPGAPTTVPTVAGLTVQQAETALAAQHLKATPVDTFSETVAKGKVISTDPGAGQRTRRGTTVDLAVSKGPERYAVPDVVGKAQSEAGDLLAADHLSVGEVTQDYSDTVPAGAVISTSPKAGVSVKRNAPVAMVVSQGKKPITVTDFTGKPLAAAQAALTKAGFTVQATQQEFSETVAKGSVVSQAPSSGIHYKGDTIVLVVSKGPPLVTVPDVVSKQENEAKQILEGAGFKVKIDRAFGGFFGTVRSSDPAAGAQVPKGSTITLLVV